MKATLISSSPTLSGAVKAINEFFFSTSYTVDPESLEILHPTKNIGQWYRVRLYRGRYRFESID
jgi:hypothetical protein